MIIRIGVEIMNKMHEALLNWKNITNQNAHYDAISAYVEATISTSPAIDKVSTWAATGSATVAGLTITNIDKMSKFYSNNEIKILFVCLAISLTLALFQKYNSMSCTLYMQIVSEVKKRLNSVLENFDNNATQIEKMAKENNLEMMPEFDFVASIDTYVNLYPWYVVWLIKKQANHSKQNRNYYHKKILTKYLYQNIFLLLQFISLIVFVGMSAYFI